VNWNFLERRKTMSKTDYPSKFFAEDKDIYDLLASGRYSERDLRLLLARRGVFLRSNLTKADLASECSRHFISWPELSLLLGEFNRPDHWKKHRVVKITNIKSRAEFEQKVLELCDANTKSASEACSYVKNKDGNADINITYAETHITRMRTIQSIRKDTFLKLRWPSNNQLELIYDDNTKASSIVADLLNKTVLEEEKQKSVHEITLVSLTKHEQRTDFFINMMRGLSSFEEAVLVTDLKFDRLNLKTKDLDSEDDEDDDGEEELNNMVKTAALSGENLLTADLYKDLKRLGFFISSSTWTSTKKDDHSQRVEFHAEFAKGAEGLDFRYSVDKIHTRDEEDKTKSQRPDLSEELMLGQEIYTSAYASLQKLST
jgi:hypothetical protein